MIHLSNTLWEITVNNDLENAVKRAIENSYETKCTVSVSHLSSNKPVVLDFSGFVADNFEDIQAAAGAAVETVGYYFGDKIDKREVSVSIKCTILQTIKIDTL